VGWVDVVTGQSTIERPELKSAFHAAVAEYQCTTQTTVPRSRPNGRVELDWVDLAKNRPGQGVRARAEQELVAMKQRDRGQAFLARALDVKTDERAWRLGADGEEAVGSRLEKLHSDGWRVLHSVPVGARGSDIDHILIGPGGVYTINTKNHHTGKVSIAEHAVWVNGHKTAYLRNSRHEADRAQRLLLAATGLSVSVRPVLVLIAKGFHMRVQPGDVTVLSRMDVPRYFKRATHALSSEQIEMLFECARRSTTWRSS